MTRHPSSQTLNAYLEGHLPEDERRAAWAHLARCSRCRARLAQRDHTHGMLRAGFAAWRPPALQGHLPGILSRVARPARGHLPPWTTALAVLLLLALGLPLVPRPASLEATPPSLHHIPSHTPTPTQAGTLPPASAARPPLPNPINIEYASPVPLPPSAPPPDR